MQSDYMSLINDFKKPELNLWTVQNQLRSDAERTEYWLLTRLNNTNKKGGIYPPF